MLEVLQQYFKETFGFSELEQGSEKPLELAVAVLLIEVALSDNEWDESERDEIFLALQEEFSLSEADVSGLLDLAHEEHGQTISFHPMVRVINDSLDTREKYTLMRALWRVALADQRVDKYEEHQIRQIADWLYIPHREFIRAKLEVQNETGP